MNREEMFNRFQSEEDWDLIVIGGGATGLGVAVDAQTRRLKTLLLEAHDFAKGTSSRSTKLVHGGVRYLEQGDIPLVLEALRERGLLHQNAPHLVHNLSFIVPRYKWWEGPFFGVGLKIYDALAGRLNLAKSRLLSREETLRKIPNVEPGNLLGGVEYFDGQFDDARLAITLARTAVDHGACLLNYCSVTGIEKTQGQASGVRFVDQETGQEYIAKAKAIINATGIFADQVRLMDDPSSISAVQPSQGVHLVFDSSFLAGESAIMVPHTDDGRVLFVIPWHGRVLVGTTDTAMTNPEIEPRPLREEIEFILRNAKRYLARNPEEADILSVFAGQRPLVRPPGKQGTPTRTISRNHEVIVSDSGMVTTVGGKWTTYRKMAEDTVNHALLVAGMPEMPCVTDGLHLRGWTEEQVDEDWLRVYGSDANEFYNLMESRTELAAPIHPLLAYPKACVVWAARHEMARTVDDVLARRTRALLLDARAAIESAHVVASLLAAELGHNEAWARHQAATFQNIAKGYLV